MDDMSAFVIIALVGTGIRRGLNSERQKKVEFHTSLYEDMYQL